MWWPAQPLREPLQGPWRRELEEGGSPWEETTCQAMLKLLPSSLCISDPPAYEEARHGVAALWSLQRISSLLALLRFLLWEHQSI